jgi:glycosyltransferase involved in cell wall biosynthesis
VLLERALGKGHAVRLGLERARGDLVIIQDADLEYDVDDYEQLLQPLLDHRAAFVLGSRHSTQRKIREFTNQLLLATILNAGHWMLTDLFNLFYGLRLKDPWTMYKVFRRDCLEGMTFECNRFDFDVELICKLVRAGFVPIELPVNYRSRSFKEGKKIRPFQDPGGWIWAVLKYRFVRPLGAQAG